MRIRKATKKDIGKIAEILMVEFSKPPYKEKWSNQRALKRINEYYKRDSHYLLVAEMDKKIIGFIAFYLYTDHLAPGGFIIDIAVTSSYQGKGIGKALISNAESFLNKKKAKTIILESDMRSKAYKIYQKKGYNKTNWVILKKKLK
ncbi:GNAT family N-acetyltransferase [Candidatus Woesearchaeota archaeon]|nr:GNAT family N-acetyltransferase [Candidatus Woesearchaeota archaeon]